MKKSFLYIPLFTIVLTIVATSCQKKEGTITLGAKIQKPINGNAKVYIDDHTPCWHNADEVYINNAVYPVMAASGSSARIENIIENSSYRAIYPASIVVDDYILNGDINSSEIIPIQLPAVQNYQTAGGHAITEVPMGAYLTSGNTLEFYNLCSIVRITISNSLNSSLNVSSIVLRAENAKLSGAGNATVNGQSSNCITMASSASHEVTLAFPDSPAYVEALQTSDSWDIVVPEFPTDNITITINTTDGQFYTVEKTNVQLQHNTITTVTINVTELSDTPHAKLVDGNTFRHAIPDNTTAVVFDYNSSVTSGTLLSTANSPYPIYGNLEGTVWVVSTSGNKIDANPNCSRMFMLCSRLVTIDFGIGFNTSDVTDMSSMFSYCDVLTNLDISSFNTSNVTNMGGMFAGCRVLTSLDVSRFNTSNVTNMGSMFSDCRGLTSLDVSNFNTSNVTNMSRMFYGASVVTSLNLSNFNTINVTDMSYMFSHNPNSSEPMSLTSLNVSNFNTSSVTNMSRMFYGCVGLTNLDVSSFNTSNVTNMECMFGACFSLRNLIVANFNTSNVTNMRYMFFRCENLSSLNVSSFNTSNVTDMSEMFRGCTSLAFINFGYNPTMFNTNAVTNMSGMFSGCSNLSYLDLSRFNTSNVQNMQAMFNNCSSLADLNLSNFDMSNLSSTGKEEMCNGLSTYSHHCTITCPSAVQTELESGTNLPTSGVTFTWLRPTSK